MPCNGSETTGSVPGFALDKGEKEKYAFAKYDQKNPRGRSRFNRCADTGSRKKDFSKDAVSASNYS